MGIPHLYKWLSGRGYKGVLQRNVPSYVSSLLLDANGIFHNSAQKTYAYGEYEDPKRRALIEKADPLVLEAEFHQVVATKLSEIIAQTRPREILVIAVDGVAPQAKIAQQRQRRYRSALDSGNEKSVFSSSSLTPGTEFMMRLDNFIQRWIVSSKNSLPPKVIYSSHMVPGEGEHIIMSLIRNGEIIGNGAHIIYGLDADLIMLSLLAPLDNIHLMREDISNVIDINNLRTAIKSELGNKIQDNNQLIQDFVVMIFLLGNDFLPHIVSLTNLDEAIETMMRVYKKTNVNITDEKGIHWKNMARYLTELGKEEGRLLELESRRDVKHPSRMMDIASTRTETIGATHNDIRVQNQITFDQNVFRTAWYNNAFKLKDKSDVFQKLLPNYNFGPNNTKLVTMIKQYLIGMSWIYRYYKMGMEFVNNDYVYRYHYAPLITDIAHLANQLGNDNFKIEEKEYIENPNATIINPVHQLLAVIPPKYKEILPPEVLHLTRTDSIIADYFPIKENIERDGYNTDWQGVLLINFVDMNRIIDAVNRSSIFSASRLEDFSPVHTIILKKDVAAMDVDEKSRKFREYLTQEESKGRGRGRGKNTGKGRGYKERKEYTERGTDQTRGRTEHTGRGRGRGYKEKGGYSKPESKVEFQVPKPAASVYKPLPVQKFEL